MDFSKLTLYIDSLSGRFNIPGCDIAVWREHKPVYRHSAGFSDYANTRPVSSDDSYNIYSATKLSTSVCALQLIERGALSLDDDVSAYIPAFADVRVRENGALVPPKTPVKLRHLITMTGGMDYNCEAAPVISAVKNGKTSTLDIVSSMARVPLGFHPGTHFKYSLCHDVLGAVIEAASGARLRDYMRRNLFEPLGMTRTGFDLDCTAAQYKYTPDGIAELHGCSFRFTPDYDSGGAGLVSTVDDYIRLMDMLACGGAGETGRRVLSEQSVLEMRTNRLSGPALSVFQQFRPQYGYGLGVRTLLDESASKSPFGEFGWDGAAGMYALADTKNRLSVFFAMHVVDYGEMFDIVHPALRDPVYECMGL